MYICQRLEHKITQLTVGETRKKGEEMTVITKRAGKRKERENTKKIMNEGLSIINTISLSFERFQHMTHPFDFFFSLGAGARTARIASSNTFLSPF